MKIKEILFSKIRNKLILGFVFISLFVAVAGYFGIKVTKDIEKGYVHISTKSLPLVQVLDNMKFACLRLISSATEFAFIKSTENDIPQLHQIEQENRLISQSCNSCHEAYSKYRKLVMMSFPEDSIFLNEIRKRGRQLQSNADEFIGLVSDGDGGIEALEKKEEMEMAEINFLHAADLAITLTTERLENEKNSLFNIINTSYRNLIIICFSALILSIAIGILYARSITKHIAKLKYQSDDFRKGNLDAIKRIDSSDEIGSLGESLYEMSMQVKSLVNQLKSEVESSKKAENEIKSKNKELRKINAEKDKFFSILAHDLKSPFNSLLGLSELIISEIENFSRDELLEYSKSFYSSISNLYKLIENLLEWAQLQRGTLSFEQSDFNMHSIIQDAIDTYKENIRSKEIVVVNKVPHNQTVYADSNMINSVIRNLLSNAVKFTMRKGTITFQAREIKGNRIHVTVRDSGVGISKSDLKILFDLDDKVRRKGTEGEPSTGLGLMLCKEFIEKNGGVLWVESEPGKGSAFNFTLNSQTVTD